MKICYIVVSAFLIIFYPRQLTHLMVLEVAHVDFGDFRHQFNGLLHLDTVAS